MQQYTTPFKTHSVPFKASGVFYGVVVAVNDKRLDIKVPRMTGDAVFKNVEYADSAVTDTPAAGELLLVSFLEGRKDDLVVLGRVKSSLDRPDVDLTGAVAGDFLQYDGTKFIAADIDLGSLTVGNYVATIAGTANEIDVSGSGVEGAAITLSLPATINADTTGSAAKWTNSRTITLGGDLTGSVSFDGSANATLTAALPSTPSFSTITSTVATGTAPLTVTSTTAVTNLNADLLDGQHGIVYAPKGILMPFAGSTAPTGWLLCDGSAVSRTTYADLFAVISTTYGVGDNSTTFNLPDLRGRIPVGLDNMGGSDAGRLSATNTLGGTGGEEKHLLIVSEMPSHTHLQNAHTHTQTNHTHANTLTDNGHTHGYLINIQHSDGTIVSGESLTSGLTLGGRRRYQDTTANNNQVPMSITNTGAQANLANATATNQNTGGDGEHNNMQPYILTNYIIKT